MSTVDVDAVLAAIALVVVIGIGGVLRLGVRVGLRVGLLFVIAFAIAAPVVS